MASTGSCCVAMKGLLLGLLATACHASTGEFPIPEPSLESGYESKVPPDFGPFEGALADLDANPGRAERLAALLLPEAVAASDIQSLLSAGELTSEELVTFYVRRIRDYDAGVFNSVAQLNPSALEEARASDASREATDEGGTPRALEGIPVLVKWNVAVAGLATTAGAVALEGWIPSRDAFLVDRLRASGAVVLGHAQMSEWANYVDVKMPNGFSAMGGQARPAYGLYDPWGSSTGSAVAASANFVPLAVGTETYGSIVSPATANGVVGLRPSTGLVSPDLVIPLCSALDTAGPIARSVEDLAVALTAMTGVEAGSAPSSVDELKETDFAEELTMNDDAGDIAVGIPAFSANASSDPRLQFLPGTPLDEEAAKIFDEYFDAENAKFAEVEQVLKGAGLEVTMFDAMDLLLHQVKLGDLLEYCFRDSFDSFASSLASTEPTFPRSNLAEVVSFNNESPSNYVPYGQDYIKQSAETEISADDFVRIQNETIADARSLLDGFFFETGADVLLVNDLSSAYAIAGYPALTVPGGHSPLSEGGVRPEGTLFNAPHLGEKNLLRVGYIYEQATKYRVNPDIEATAEMIQDALNIDDADVDVFSTSSAACNRLLPLFILVGVGVAMV